MIHPGCIIAQCGAPVSKHGGNVANVTDATPADIDGVGDGERVDMSSVAHAPLVSGSICGPLNPPKSAWGPAVATFSAGIEFVMRPRWSVFKRLVTSPAADSEMATIKTATTGPIRRRDPNIGARHPFCLLRDASACSAVISKLRGRGGVRISRIAAAISSQPSISSDWVWRRNGIFIPLRRRQ